MGPSDVLNRRSYLEFWTTREIVRLGLMMGFASLISILFFDQPLTQWLNFQFKGLLDPYAKIITFLGLGDTYFLVSTIGFLVGYTLSRKPNPSKWISVVAYTKNHFLFMLYCFLTSGLIVMVLKSLFGRSRPYNSPNFNAINFEPFNLNWDFQSYPSGHSQVGFTLASFLSLLFPKGTIYFYLLATTIGLSRIILEKHYLGDVLAGAYIGILGTYLTWHFKGKYLFQSL